MTRVLIADDHPLLLSGIAQLLDRTAYEVVATVSEGSGVTEAINSHSPDIVILDVNMPGLNGLEITRLLVEREARPHIVLLTAELGDDELLDAMALKVEGILLKNGGERLLLDCLDRVSAGGRYLPQDLLNRATALQQERERDPLRTLTPREVQLAELVAQGLRNRAIAEELHLSEGTVKVYLNRIYEKLDISSRTELVIAMTQSGDTNA